MPAWTEEAEKASALKRRAAKLSRDKAVEAQRKNKLETAELQLYHAMLDRRKVRTTVLLNREKEELRHVMRRMRKTTGFCKEGLPPRGPTDKEHEKSPYFQTTGHVSEKRLQKWKNEERALQRILMTDDELRPPWEKGSLEVAEETLGHLLNILGYDEEEAKVMMENLRQNEDDAHVKQESPCEEESEPDHKQTTLKKGGKTLRSASASSFGALSSASDPSGRLDVFECLKDGDSKAKGVLNEGKNGSLRTKLLGSASADDIFRSGFSVRDWERQMTERYKNSLINLAAKQESTGDGGDNAIRKNRPKSAPAKTGSALRTRSLLARRRQKLNDEGSESGRDGAPLSAATSITDLRTEGGQGDVETDPQPCPPSGARSRPRQVTARAVQATRGSVVDKSRPATAYKKRPPLPPSVAIRIPHGASVQGESEGNTGTDPVPKTPPQGINNTRQIQRRSSRERMHGSETDLTTSAKDDDLQPITEEQECVTEPPAPLHKPATGRRVSTTLPVGRRRLSSAPSQGPSLMSRLYKRSQSLPMGALLPSGINSSPKLGDTSRRRTLPVVHDLGDSEEDEEDTGQSKEQDLRAQWRRNLLKEAPPGFGTRDDKIRLAVSKSQLRRDMEQMVVEHECDIRETIRKEHIRRMRKRMDIMLTLQKLTKTPDEPETPDTVQVKDSVAPKLATNISTIMQMLKLKKKAQMAKEAVAGKALGSVQEQEPQEADV